MAILALIAAVALALYFAPRPYGKARGPWYDNGDDDGRT